MFDKVYRVRTTEISFIFHFDWIPKCSAFTLPNTVSSRQAYSVSLIVDRTDSGQSVIVSWVLPVVLPKSFEASGNWAISSPALLRLFRSYRTTP
jgi:hypothetical protein